MYNVPPPCKEINDIPHSTAIRLVLYFVLSQLNFLSFRLILPQINKHKDECNA